MAALAWVESPLQLLSALEAAHPGEQLEIQVRGDAPGIAEFLDRFDRAWLPAGTTLRTGLHGPTAPLASSGTGAAAPVDRLLLGDPCSGRFQAALARRRFPLPPRVTLIDDGLATEHAVRLLTAARPAPLQRARQRLSPARRALALTAALRLRGLLRAGRLTWTTALSVAPDLGSRFAAAGGTLDRHTFDRLRALDLTTPDLPGTIVLGSSLAADGLIDPAAYLDWVGSVAADTTCAYLPHRRERAADLAAIAALPGITVHPAGLPVELRLAAAPRGARLLSLPTTAAANLALTMDSPDIRVSPIPQDWWTGSAPDALRRDLNRSAAPRGYTDRMSRFSVVAVSDSESYLKWAARTMDALGPGFDAQLWLMESPILPTGEQIRNALIGSSWEGREIPVIARRELEDELARIVPDVVLAAATGPVVQQIYASAARLPRRPGLVSGLPGVGLPATSKGMRYRRIGDMFITHSHHERAEYEFVTQKVRVPVEVVVARLPLLSSVEPPDPQFDPADAPDRIVFATQAKVPVERADRIRILLALAEYRRRHPESEVIVKVRSRPGEQETHHEEFTYLALIDELVADGRLAEGELTTAVGAMSLFLTPGSALVTVSSTAALEAIDRGLPTLILDDFGVSEKMLNLAFEDSGIIGSLADMVDGRIGFPTRDWLRQNYFQEPNTELVDAVTLLAVRSREEQLPDLRRAARVQDLRRVRAELRTMAPAPVVTAYRAVANRARAAGRWLKES
ncbi:DUF6716 putative glycosyltransferase [Brevibacterium ihuae]|uniref:DUF6716 putative glycosyltransferase n=1 Tax=Brevibacterium ihuae TaxID=1631743 RepID=UPI000C7685F9|nr:DUF6716 putative glycosyltransferase [Brevibacterium ihuae]